MLHLRVAEQAEDADALTIQLPYGTQQRRFLIQRLAAVRAEDGGDIQRTILDKGVGGGVPCRVAAGLEGGAQAAGGEAGGIGLAFCQFLGTQLHPHALRAVGGDEAVVLLGGVAGHGLEPVGIVGGAVFDGPVLHDCGDLTGGGTIQRRTLCPAALPCAVDLGGETLLHLLLAKHHFAEQGGDIDLLFTHLDHSFQSEVRNGKRRSLHK